MRFSRDFDQFTGIDFGRLDDVYVRMRGGDDTVVIDMGSASIPDDLVVSLGTGDNVLAVVGDDAAPGMVHDDMRVYASRGDDQISLAQLSIRDDLILLTSRGSDVVTIQELDVHDRTIVRMSSDDDTVVVANSRFEDRVLAANGSGHDAVGLIDNTFENRLYVNGQRGFDSAFLDAANVADRLLKVRGIEKIAGTVAEFQPEANAAIEQVEAWFTNVASTLDDETADLFQNQLADLSASFGIPLINLNIDPATQFVTVNDPTPTVSVLWDQAVQEAVINTSPGPTIASRAYAMLHTAMYDAWSAYDETAISTLLGDDLQQPAAENTKTNKMEAMSFAAYRVLDDLFASESDIFSNLMSALGYDPADTTTDPFTPAGVGNAMAAALLELRHADGSNQLGDDPDGDPYSNVTAYEPVNGPGNTVDIELWTPEFVPIDAAPGTEDSVQQFLTPQWGDVTPFSLASGDQFRPAAAQPFLLVEATVDLAAGTITLADGTVESISRDLIGTAINPEFIAQAEEVIEFSANLTDEQKLIAEFWEDGDGTSFPPGTWMTFGEFVSARDNHTLDQDAQMFFALGNAVFDTGIATWEAKVFYDYVRPVRAIRELGRLGLIGEFDDGLGGYVIEAWKPGEGTQTILATEFLTYQTPGSDPSPPFAEYTSGHSGFSSAAAEILRLFTGSDDFDASVSFAPGQSRFEPGITPVQPVTLYWNTFTIAAVEAGISRLYGGIHFSEGNLTGQTLGRQIGETVWERAQFFISGGRVT